MILILSLLTGLMTGIYFTFSFVVVKALSRMPNNESARAMNSINDVIVKTWFMPLFILSSLCYLGLLIWSAFFSSGSQPHFIWASLFYLFGMFGVTAVCNVPLNNQLKLYASDSHKLTKAWDRYTRKWVPLNHVRTASCTVAFALLNYGPYTVNL